MSTTVSAPAPTTPRTRAAVVAGLLALGAVAVAVLVLWQPWGGRNVTDYPTLAAHRDAGWLGSLLDALAMAAVGVGLGLAVNRLAPQRGSGLATVGSLLTGFGSVAFAIGIAGFGSFIWYATEPAALAPDAGGRLVDYAVANAGHLMGVQMAGFLLFTLGSLVLMGALWRSGTVPRWLPVAYAVLTVGLFVADGGVLNVVQAVQTLLLLPVAYFASR